jgi:hypothetical protein
MFDRHPLTNAICALLRGANGEIGYAAIEAATGKPLAELRQTLNSARTYLERDEGIVFVTVRGQGLRRLTDAEKVESASGFTRRIRRTAGKGVQRLNAVTAPDALSNADQLARTIRMTVFQAIQRESSQDAGK